MDIHVITPDQDCLMRQRTLEYEHYTWAYQRNRDNEHTDFILAQMLDCDTKCAWVLNIISSIFATVVDKYVAWIWKPQMEYEMDHKGISKGLLIHWMVWLELVKTTNSYEFQSIPASELFEVNDTEERIIRIKRIQLSRVEDPTKYDYYVFKREYTAGKIYNRLYKMLWPDSLIWARAELSDIYVTEWLSEEEDTWLDYNSVVILDYESIIEKIKTLVYAIERKLVSYNVDIIKFWKQKRLYKWFQPNAVNEIIENDADYVVTNDATASIETITTKNEYVELMAWLIKDELRLISSATHITTDSFWFDSTSSIWLEAQESKKQDFVDMVNDLRNVIKDWIIELSQWINSEFTIHYSNVWYSFDKELIETILLAKQWGLISNIDAITKALNLSTPQAEEKLNEINGQENTEVTE